MTDKEKILAFLEGMSKGCCPKETKEIIINKIIPWINDLPEEPVSEDLEDAAEDYCKSTLVGSRYIKKNAFKAGAQWQKEQMMAKAIDAHCFGFQGAALFSFRLPASKYLVGSEVKVIVIKED